VSRGKDKGVEPTDIQKIRKNSGNAHIQFQRGLVKTPSAPPLPEEASALQLLEKRVFIERWIPVLYKSKERKKDGKLDNDDDDKEQLFPSMQ